MENSSNDRKIKYFAFDEKCADQLYISLVNDFELEKQPEQVDDNTPIIEFDKQLNDSVRRLR